MAENDEPREQTWTDDEVEKLRELANDNYTYQEIANKLDRTMNSVIGKCNFENIEVVNSSKAPKFSTKSCKDQRVFRRPNRNKIENRILWGVLYVEKITPPLLAEFVGVTARTIQRALYDGYPPSEKVQQKVSEVLNVPANILFGDIAYSKIDDEYNQRVDE